MKRTTLPPTFDGRGWDMATQNPREAAGESVPRSVRTPTNNGVIIPCWSETAQEYMVMEKFPRLMKRFETGLHCLTSTERLELRKLAEMRGHELPCLPIALHSKVSLLAGGNLCHVVADAIVNASNVTLSPGKGVNGTVHSAAGPGLWEECQGLGGCEVGEAKITHGWDLLAHHVIHTVGPEGQTANRADLLGQCYSSSLQLCLHEHLVSVAFPCISAGMFAYPCLEAADLALATVRRWLLSDDNHCKMERVVFVTRRLKDEEAYATLMLRYFPAPKA